MGPQRAEDVIGESGEDGRKSRLLNGSCMMISPDRKELKFFNSNILTGTNVEPTLLTTGSSCQVCYTLCQVCYKLYHVLDHSFVYAPIETTKSSIKKLNSLRNYPFTHKSPSSSSAGNGCAAASFNSLLYCSINAGSMVTSGGARAGAATNSKLGFLTH